MTQQNGGYIPIKIKLMISTSVETPYRASLQGNDGYKFSPYQGMPEFFITATSHSNFEVKPVWYRNFSYEIEQQRGYDANEDLFSPAIIELSLANNAEVIVAGSLTELTQDLAKLWQAEVTRRKKLSRQLKANNSAFPSQLKIAAYSFLQNQLPTDAKSVTAGFHWFLEWGRDAMIALPGLTLYSGLENECVAVLKEFAAHEKEGLIPNVIANQPANNSYNSVDASLWFAWAVQQYYLHTKNIESVVDNFWSTLKNIFNHYKNGTWYNIKMQANGLLYAGSKDVNVSWMDAVVAGKPVTARYGLQVETNALWFNMLSFMEKIAKKISDPIKDELASLLPTIKSSFRQTFYDKDLGYLYDFVNDEEQNTDLRPNQIFAISLPYSPLVKTMATKVLAKVSEHLLTPYGLRTLSPQAANYCGTYEGNQATRDYAYHNGTVWPWLLGHFGEALIKTYDQKIAMKTLQPCFLALQQHLDEYGIGTIAEVFSGDAPHQANGCISQAWSVAEVLRLTHLIGD